MPSTDIELGDPIQMSLTLQDLIGLGSGQFPQAEIFDAADAAVAGSPFDLTEVDSGRYTSAGFTPLVEGSFTVKYITYTDALHANESFFHGRVEETITVRRPVQDAVWDELLTGAAHFTANSAGEIMQIIQGILYGNAFLDNTLYNAAGLLIAGRVRIGGTKAITDGFTDGAANGAESEIARFAITGVAEGTDAGLGATYKMTREA